MTDKSKNVESAKAPKLPALVKAKPAPSNSGRNARFLSHAEFLEEAGPRAGVGAAIMTIGGFMLAGVIWAFSTDIDEAAIAQGAIQPSGSIRFIQHLEGGIVSDLKIKEGDLVEADQVLIKLDPTDAVAQLDKARATHAALSLRIERINALVEDREPDFSASSASQPKLVQSQLRILEAQRVARDTQRDVFLTQKSELGLQLQNLRKQRTGLKRELELVQEELRLRKTLVEKGLMSKIVYLDTQRTATRAESDLGDVIGQIRSTKESIVEIEDRIVELEARLRHDALQELGTADADLAEVREEIVRLTDRIRRLDVRSPVRGLVKTISTKTVGGVVSPAAPLVEIVPVEEELIVEAQISPEDIGHIAIGQVADIRVSSFDYARYGSIVGVLEDLSPSTSQVEGQPPFYKATIRLDQSYIGSDPNNNLLLPGMTVQASVNTGTRTLAQYLLKPIYRALDLSFRER